MTPDISIVMPTMRVGGLDIVFESLKHQTFKNFELIISDSLFQYRKELVTNKAKEYDFAVKHIEPTKNAFPIGHFCNAENTALVNVSTNIVLMITDYTYLPEDCVEKHIKFHTDFPAENYGFMGSHRYNILPELNTNFPTYANDGTDTDKYVDDIKDGKFDSMMWSIFSKDFAQHPETLPLDSMGNADTKLFMKFHHNADQNLFNGKNESIKTEAALKINGWDEDLDGTTPYQDSLFSDMLVHMLGFVWTVDGSNISYIVNPRSIFPWSKRMRPINTNLELWRSKCAAGYNNNKTNGRSIRDERAANLAKGSI